MWAIGTREIECASSEDGNDGEHNAVGFVEISKIFVKLEQTLRTDSFGNP